MKANPLPVEIREHPHCCGARDIQGMNHRNFTPSRLIRGILEQHASYARPPSGKINYAGTGFFNLCVACNGPDDRWRLKRMTALKQYIDKHKLGTLTIGVETGNPNYAGQHRIIPAIFVPDNKAMRAWGIKRGWIDNKWFEEMQRIRKMFV